VTGFRYSIESGYFVVDDSGPIFIAVDRSAKAPAPTLEVGQQLEIEGVTDPGRYAAQVRETRRTVVGRSALPSPRRLTYEQIASGGEDSELAEIEGIVRSTSGSGLMLAMGDGRVDVTTSTHESAELQGLIDARVRLRGVVSGRFNKQRQWVGTRFNVSSRDGIVVEKLPPADQFAAPTRAIRELLQWPLNQAGGHRVKVRGVVTHFQPGSALFIREKATGLQIWTRETQALAPGDVVEALGFPVLGTYSAAMEDATYRRVRGGPPPESARANPEQLLRGEWDSSLVTVRGTLLDSVRQQGARVLVMQADDLIFHARLRSDAIEPPEAPTAGSLLDLTGICVVAETTIEGARLNPRLFSLLLRSPADIRILQQPPWWTPRRLWQALSAISLLALGILAWVWLLRRQVRAQTAALKGQTQREAILEERTRIAQELHDTLDQELTGISLQLNAAAAQLKEGPAGNRLELVHRLLRRSQSEVRRSVWDLRRPALESGGLPVALEETAAQLRSDSTATFDVGVHGEARPLPALVEHHLLRIAAEAMTNAFKHAAARHISVALFYEPEFVRLRVQDDGRGFDAGQAPNHATGHFGLIGMRERTRKSAGCFSLESAPGHGTRIEIRVPGFLAAARPKVVNGA
jgi:signal transduction histidine kinase